MCCDSFLSKIVDAVQPINVSFVYFCCFWTVYLEVGDKKWGKRACNALHHAQHLYCFCFKIFSILKYFIPTFSSLWMYSFWRKGFIESPAVHLELSSECTDFGCQARKKFVPALKLSLKSLSNKHAFLLPPPGATWAILVKTKSSRGDSDMRTNTTCVSFISLMSWNSVSLEIQQMRFATVPLDRGTAFHFAASTVDAYVWFFLHWAVL